MNDHKPWLWPDHVIGKAESRELREEHNRAVNALAAFDKAGLHIGAETSFSVFDVDHGGEPDDDYALETGWYYIPCNVAGEAVADEPIGPFESSAAAYDAAMADPDAGADQREGSPWDRGYKAGFADGVDDFAPALIEAARKVAVWAPKRRDLQTLERLIKEFDDTTPREPSPLIAAAQAALFWLEAERDSDEPGATMPDEIIRVLRAGLGKPSPQTATFETFKLDQPAASMGGIGWYWHSDEIEGSPFGPFKTRLDAERAAKERIREESGQ